MRVQIWPGKAKGTVMAPPSKSMAHRMLIGAGLAKGTSRVEHIALSEDIQATLGILQSLGAEITMEGQSVIIRGIGNRPFKNTKELECRESGSTLRFFLPLLLTQKGEVGFRGAKRLLERPLGIYENICREQKIRFCREEQQLTLEGKLCPGTFQVEGNISSQFITGLLFALPLLEEDSQLEMLPPVESRAYIDMTLEVLRMCQIQVIQEGNRFKIPGNQTYQPILGNVEGDYSNAAFLEAWNLLGGDVKVEGLKANSLQGDQVYREYFQELKAGNPRLDISECPDLGPILMGMAACLHGATLTGTRRLKMKESDRGTVMAEELKKFGILCKIEENQITVCPGDLQTLTEDLDSHNDHRIAMTLSLLASLTGGKIEDAQSVKKSYPDYFDTIEQLGIQIERQD